MEMVAQLREIRIAYVPPGSEGDIGERLGEVRFTPENGPSQARPRHAMNPVVRCRPRGLFFG